MKKILLIAIIISLGYVKGYSQLMQSNSIGASAKMANTVTIPHLNKIVVKSDSLIKNISTKTDTAYLKSLNESKTINQTLLVKQGQIDALAVKRNAATDDEKQSYQDQINNLAKERDDLANKLKSTQEDSKKASAENFSLRNQITDLVINKYELYMAEVDTELNQYKKEISKNASKALSSFKSAISSGSVQDQHNIDSISNIMNLDSYIIQSKLNTLTPQRDSINKHLQDLKQLKNDLAKYNNIQDVIYLKLAATIDKIETLGKSFTDTKQTFIVTYNTYIETTNKNIDNLNTIADKIKKDSETEATEAQKISALGGINKIFGDQGALAPTISIVGQKKFSSSATSSFYGEVKLFIGGNDDDKKNTGVNKLFIPDASTYGFMTDFSWGFIGSNKSSKIDKLTNQYEQKLAINVGVYYLGKKLRPDTLTDFNTSLFHIKLGLQYILIPHVLSAYINTNQLLVATNIKQFESYYSDAKTVHSFTSFGLQSYLDLNDNKDFHLFIDLGFVKINNDVNTWLQSADTIIPNVKLSLVKTFGF